jgi:predicted phosphodiesterase
MKIAILSDTHDNICNLDCKLVGKTLLTNPSAVCGIQAGKPNRASFGVYDTSANTFAHFDLKP